MPKISEFQTYFFIFAHPDDEVYSCILMNRLIKQGKAVHAIYITSGDAGGQADMREKELASSMQLIGLNPNNLHLLRTPELSLLHSLTTVVKELQKLAEQYHPDCVIGQDYEGGHEGHDAASFCASELVKKANIPNHFVFPIYHGKPDERKGARFKPTRTNIITCELNEDEKDLKANVMKAHAGQQGHFERLKKEKDYSNLLFSREVFVQITEPIDYTQKPMEEVGYEYHNNGFKFTDFARAVKKTKSEENINYGV